MSDGDKARREAAGKRKARAKTDASADGSPRGAVRKPLRDAAQNRPSQKRA